MILNLEPNVAYTLAAILAFLLLATVFILIKRKVRPGSGDGSLLARTLSWWVMVLLLAGSLAGGRLTVLLFFAFVSFGALKEFLTLIPIRHADRRVLFWAYIAIPLQYWLISTGVVTIFTIFIPLYIFMVIPMRMISIGETKGFIRGAATIQWAVMACVYALSHVAAHMIIPELPSRTGITHAHSGPALVLFLLITAQMNDVAAFIWGKSIGGPKCIPSVSPNKTWAGLIGGVLTAAAIAAFIGPFLTPMSRVESLLAGLGIALVGFCGDATLSALKRDLGVKDAGSIIPGHGGVLDRVNSLMFAAPISFHLIRTLHY
jgi:phosphatidate cytidylyltransferase